MKPPLARILEAGGVSVAQWTVSTIFEKVKARFDTQKKLTARVEKAEEAIKKLEEGAEELKADAAIKALNERMNK